MSDVDPRGIWVPVSQKMEMPEHLKVAVHCGPREEMDSMATIDLDDLDSLVSETDSFKFASVYTLHA